jgi:diaminohydroxyphosphoribosylaminopyrimidine deaminase / 5-amino-6-(5-phosphoribosylamino)uracil reductase
MDASQHNGFMQRCLQLAEMGRGWVAPNPMVGAVLVYNEMIIGEGYHQKFGGPHAEVNCINSVPPQLRCFIEHAVLYVSLEPCAHYGKTPPCSSFIIQHKIQKVVIGCRDPFTAVNGKGIEQLLQAGIEVIVGVLEVACQNLNAHFFHFHTKHQPFISLKWAQTADGFIGSNKKKRLLISSATVNRLVHRWRAAHMAIMVGTQTTLLDNPTLNNRYWPGNTPAKLILDLKHRLPEQLAVWDPPNTAYVFTHMQEMHQKQVQTILMNQQMALVPQILEACVKLGFQSILIEGGAQLLQSFIDENCFNEIICIQHKQMQVNDGVKAPHFNAKLYKQKTIEQQDIFYYQPL